MPYFRRMIRALIGLSLATALGAQPDSLRIRIVATHDVHGALQALTYPWSGGRWVGGLAAVKATEDSAAARCRCTTFRLDGGDEMQGTLESNLVHGQSAVRAFNQLGLDAAAIGNHELDWGVDTLVARQKDAKYPWLAANVFLKGTRTRPSWAKPWAIVTKNRVRLGVVGYLTAGTPATQRPVVVAPYEFRAGVSPIADALAAVRAERPDFIVIVAHAGGDCNADRCGGEMVDLARGLDSAGVDLIVGGHAHTSGGGVVNGIPIVRASSDGRAISVADLVRTRTGAHRFALARDTVWTDAVTPDAGVIALLRPYLARVDSAAHVPVATLRDSLFAARGLGSALARSLREAASADVGMTNGGGVRTNLMPGVVTYGDAFRVTPFGNIATRISMTGRDLRRMIEHALAGQACFWDGIRLRYDPDAPAGHRILSLAFADGRPIADDTKLRLGLPDFIADGGAGFDMLTALPAEKLDFTMLDAFIALLQRQPQPVSFPRDSSVVAVRQTAPQADARFDALVSLAESKMKEFGVPGVAIGVIANGVSTIRGLGVTNVEDPLPVTAHTVFPIASISKTFAATAVMRLVEQGKIDLQAPVRTYLPDFRVRDSLVSRDVKVWHLLTHLGGWEGQVSGSDRGSETLKNFVGSITDLMQIAPPGAAWSYNNAGFSIAGRVIEVVTGQSINQAIRSLVFQPLGLEHAGTTSNEFIVNRFAAGHFTRGDSTRLQRPFAASTSVTAGGVGLCMTDLLAYARFHMGDGTAASGQRVLTRESLERMRTPQSPKQSTDDQIGIAWHIRTMSGGLHTYSHGGTLAGHILLLEIVPERNFAIAILTNANSGWRLIQDVERAALKSYLGATYALNQGIAHRGLVETLPAVEPLAKQPDFAPYVGSYARPSNTVVVRIDTGRLMVDNAPVAFFGPDRAVVTDGTDRGQTIEFVRDGRGRVMWVRVVGRTAVRTP